MDPEASLTLWAAVWPLLGVVVVIYSGLRVRAGLVLAYLASLGLIHWVAVLLYLDSSYAFFDRTTVALGFQISTYGLLSFLIGSIVIAPALMTLGGSAMSNKIVAVVSQPGLPRRSLILGLVSFFVLLPVAGRIATLTSLISAGWNLALAGLALYSWRAWKQRRMRALLGWLAVGLSMPLITLTNKGFVSYGIATTIVLLAFVMPLYRPRWHLIVVGLLLAYVGISVYVTYMRDRTVIRSVVWSDQGITDRLQVVTAMLTNLEWFDPNNPLHRERIDERLNQSYLVGATAQYLDLGSTDYADGATVVDSFVALIPRFVWPDKPVVGGSSDLVSRYTGVQFGEGTSVGIGHIMELYVNFGTAGVVLGLLILGSVLGVIDRRAGEHLAQGDYFGFMMWFVPAIGLLQVSGSLAELTTSVAASLIMIRLVRGYLTKGSPAAEPKAAQPGPARAAYSSGVGGWPGHGRDPSPDPGMRGRG